MKLNIRLKIKAIYFSEIKRNKWLVMSFIGQP